MNFFKNIFGKQNAKITTYTDFWEWFLKNQTIFYNVIKKKGDVEKIFVNKLFDKLKEVKEGFYFLAGMLNNSTVELIFTADGNLKNISFVEEFVAAAPQINGWIFTALKPALDIKDVHIEMYGYKFNDENISFYANEHEQYPDEIDITLVHNDLNKENKGEITSGTFIFLENFLGELNFATSIDIMDVKSHIAAKKELIPIEKLKDYLVWRQKEFTERYQGIRHDTENDSYTGFELTTEKGNAIVAVINADLMAWDSKASHPWIIKLVMRYNGSKTNGMPDKKTYAVLDEIENHILNELKDSDGYLNIGRETGNNLRTIFFACNDFRKPSKVIYKLTTDYASQFKFEYEIYKDKYWQTFERYATI